MNKTKPYFWDYKKPNFLSYLLLIFTIPIIINNFFLNRKKNKKFENIKTICIGNIYVGGTAKTPLTIKISQILSKLNIKNATIKKFYKNQIDEQNLLRKKTNLYCFRKRRDSLKKAIQNNFDVALFSLFEIYPLSKFISIVSLILIVTFFVTSSDSGALVASMLSSKKQTSINDDSPITSRATWAILLGILAGVLLYAGGLKALQTSVVITGVPFAIIVVFACRKFYKSLDKELNKIN